MIRLLRMWWLRRVYMRAVADYADHCALPTGIWSACVGRALLQRVLITERALSDAINPRRGDR